MSYIRCLSNPEGLYIVNTRRGVEIYVEQNEYKIPPHVFHGILKKWHDTQDDVVRYRGAKIEVTKDFKWRLSYKDWSFVMWQTTLMYICTQNKFRWGE